MNRRLLAIVVGGMALHPLHTIGQNDFSAYMKLYGSTGNGIIARNAPEKRARKFEETIDARLKRLEIAANSTGTKIEMSMPKSLPQAEMIRERYRQGSLTVDQMDGYEKRIDSEIDLLEARVSAAQSPFIGVRTPVTVSEIETVVPPIFHQTDTDLEMQLDDAKNRARRAEARARRAEREAENAERERFFQDSLK